MNKIKGVLSLIAAMACAGQAGAATIDFDQLATGRYDAGTNFSGVVFDEAIQIRTFAAGAGGPGMSGNIARMCDGPFCSQFGSGQSIGGSFDGFTVSSLSLVAGDSGGDIDTLNLQVFDAAGGLLGQTGVISSASSVPLSLSFAGIASFFLEIEDVPAGFNGSSAFDNISFDVEISPVPLPASLPMLAFALGGIGLMRRKRG